MKIPYGTETFRRKNPHLFALGALAPQEPKPTAAPALDRVGPEHQAVRSGRVRCSLTAFRRRLLDGDNAVASLKPLQDCIARYLGIDDADPRITWEYAQVRTDGEEGVIVKLEVIQ